MSNHREPPTNKLKRNKSITGKTWTSTPLTKSILNDTTIEPKTRKELMQGIINNPILKAEFNLFAVSITAEENVRFYDQILFFEKISPTNEFLLKEKYQEIVNEFLLEGSPNQINVGKVVKRKTFENAEHLTPDVFFELKEDVFSMMCKNMLPLFMTRASDQVKLVNMSRIEIPILLLGIMEKLSNRGHNLKHFSYDLSDPRIYPYLNHTSDMTLSIRNDIDLASVSSGKVLGALFKIYLFTYPIPIITAELPIFFDIVLDKKNYLGRNGDMRELINILPSSNQAILHMVCEFLSCYKSSFVTYTDIAEIFTPLLFRLQRTVNNDIRTMAYLLEYYEQLFIVPDFRCDREETIAHTKKQDYPQVNVDLNRKYEVEIKRFLNSDHTTNFAVSDRKLSDIDWQIILLSSDELYFKEGVNILQSGQLNDSIYYIREGSALVTEEIEGDVVQRNILLPNNIFGEISLVTNGVCSANVSLTPETRVCKIPFNRLSRIFQEDLSLCRKFYGTIAEKLAQTVLLNDPELITANRKFSLETINNVNSIEKEYFQKFNLEDPEEMLLKQFFLRNGVLWFGKKYMCMEEITIFQNRKIKVAYGDITSAHLSLESCSIRIERKKKKKLKLFSDNEKDLKQFVMMLENICKDLHVEDSISPSEETELFDRKNDFYLTDKEWEIILGGSAILVKKKGEVIIKQGRRCGQLFVICRGSARAEIFKNDEPYFLGLIEQGETFGDISYILDKRTTCTVTANEDTELFCIHRRYIELLFYSYPTLGAKFKRHICRILGRRIRQRINSEQIHDESSQHLDVPSRNLNSRLTIRNLNGNYTEESFSFIEDSEDDLVLYVPKRRSSENSDDSVYLSEYVNQSDYEDPDESDEYYNKSDNDDQSDENATSVELLSEETDTNTT